MLAGFSLLLAAFLWGLLYGFVYWICLFVVTLSRSFNPATLLEITNADLISRWFPAWFAVGAMGMMALASFAGRRIHAAKLRERRLYVLWVAYELFMMIPNVTFGIWGNLRAIVRLPPREALRAWRVLDHIGKLGGRLAIAHVASEMEEPETLPRILVVLQIAELLGVRENEDGWFYYLQNREAIPQLAMHTGIHPAA